MASEHTVKVTADVQAAVKPGEQTTEYSRAQAAGWCSAIGMILGSLVAFTPKIMELLGSVVADDSQTYLVTGMVLSIVSVVYRFGIDAGYIQSRTRVKERAEDRMIALLMRDVAIQPPGEEDL